MLIQLISDQVKKNGFSVIDITPNAEKYLKAIQKEIPAAILINKRGKSFFIDTANKPASEMVKNAWIKEQAELQKELTELNIATITLMIKMY